MVSLLKFFSCQLVMLTQHKFITMVSTSSLWGCNSHQGWRNCRRCLNWSYLGFQLLRMHLYITVLHCKHGIILNDTLGICSPQLTKINYLSRSLCLVPTKQPWKVWFFSFSVLNSVLKSELSASCPPSNSTRSLSSTFSNTARGTLKSFSPHLLGRTSYWALDSMTPLGHRVYLCHPLLASHLPSEATL